MRLCFGPNLARRPGLAFTSWIQGSRKFIWGGGGPLEPLF